MLNTGMLRSLEDPASLLTPGPYTRVFGPVGETKAAATVSRPVATHGGRREPGLRLAAHCVLRAPLGQQDVTGEHMAPARGGIGAAFARAPGTCRWSFTPVSTCKHCPDIRDSSAVNSTLNYPEHITNFIRTNGRGALLIMVSSYFPTCLDREGRVESCKRSFSSLLGSFTALGPQVT